MPRKDENNILVVRFMGMTSILHFYMTHIINLNEIQLWKWYFTYPTKY